jgi:hypothetical protein
MSDLTTLVTTIAGHATALGVIYKGVGPFVTKILGPAADEIGEIGRDYVKGLRTRNVGRTLTDAATLLDATGREAQAVPLKVLDPLLNAASMEEEATLAEKWAALLANAADPAQQAPVQPAFVEVLRQLTATDAQVVSRLYQAAEHSSGTEKMHTVFPAGMMSGLKLTQDQMRLSMDNLIRLQLCKPVATYGGYSTESFEMPSAVLMTTFGLRFIQSCTPPTA